MMEGGRHLAALKGTTFMDPQVIADTAPFPAHRNSTPRNFIPIK
jgi:hypothetical protein